MSENKDLPEIQQPVAIIFNPGTPSTFQIKSVFDSEAAKGRLKLRLMEDYNPELMNSAKSSVLEFSRSDALYQLPATFLEIVTEKDPTFVEEVRFILLAPQYPAKRIQRRNYVRLPLRIPVKFRPVKLPDGYETNRDIRKQALSSWETESKHLNLATSFDLSAGGIAIDSPAPLKRDDILYLEFSLPETSFKLAGKIVLLRQNQKHDEQSCIAGIQFIGIEQKEQDGIAQYIFKQQSQRVKVRQG